MRYLISLSLFYFFVRSHVISPQSKHHLLWHEKDYDGELLLSPVWQLFFLSPWNKIENLLLPFFVPLNYIFELMEAQKKSGGQRTFKKEPLKLSFWQKGGWPAWNLELESGLYISIFYLEKATETFDTFPTFANDILKTLKIIAFNFFVHFLFCSALISKGKVFH